MIINKVQNTGEIKSQSKVVEPSLVQQTIVPDEEYNVLDRVLVLPVTSSIDRDIVAENIRKNVNILGVTGNLNPYSNSVYISDYSIGNRVNCNIYNENSERLKLTLGTEYMENSSFSVIVLIRNDSDADVLISVSASTSMNKTIPPYQAIISKNHTSSAVVNFSSQQTGNENIEITITAEAWVDTLLQRKRALGEGMVLPDEGYAGLNGVEVKLHNESFRINKLLKYTISPEQARTVKNLNENLTLTIT